MVEGTPISPQASAWSWTKGLHPSWAPGLELARAGVAAFLVVNLVFAAFFLSVPQAPGLSFTPHDPKYAGVAAYDRQVFALDQPVGTQYLVFVWNAFTGNLGLSYYYRTPVTGAVWSALPLTFELTIASLLWALLVGGLLGWAASSRRFPRIRALPALAGSVLYGLPVFAAVLLLVFWASTAPLVSFRVPDVGLPRVTGFFTLDSLLAGNLDLFGRALGTTALLAMPAGLAFALPVLHRVRRAIEARRTAAAFASLPANRGLPFLLALRASVVPIVGAVGVLLPFAFGASFVAELASGRRGVGFEMFLALNNLDAPLFLGMLLVPCLVVVVAALPFTLTAAFFSRSLPKPRAPFAPPAWEPRMSIPAFTRRLLRFSSLPVWIGLALVAIPVGLSLTALWIAPLGPLVRVVPVGSICTPRIDCPLSPPSAAHPLGIDFYGMDILFEVLWGGLYLIGALLLALCAAAGLGLVLGLFLPPTGRAADLPARAVLGGMAALPVVILLWLLATAMPLWLALGLAFVPVVFRDVRDLGESGAAPFNGAGTCWLSIRGWADRVDAGGRTAIPGFLARLPRRAAEMALLAEGVAFLFAMPPGPVDWASIFLQGVSANALIIGNPWWLGMPALLLGLLAVGLVLLSDGLRSALAGDAAPPIPAAPAPALQPPPIMGGNP